MRRDRSTHGGPRAHLGSPFRRVQGRAGNLLVPGAVGWTRASSYADTRGVVRVTGVTVAYVWCHGDPYVFPAGFAEQEHVQVRPVQRVRRRRLEHPIPEYAATKPPPPSGAGRSSKRAPTRTRRPAPRAVRSGPGPVAPGLRRARPRRGRGLARHRPRARRASPGRSGAAPATSTPSSVATASGCSSSGWPSSPRPPSGGSCPAR